jgi:hypothetical protein
MNSADTILQTVIEGGGASGPRPLEPSCLRALAALLSALASAIEAAGGRRPP